MPSLSKLYKSAKNSLCNSNQKKKEREKSNDSTSNKSVRFSTPNESIYYTHSSLEYDRKSLAPYDEYVQEADSLKSSCSSGSNSSANSSLINAEDMVGLFDEEVIRNTKVNKKQGHYSIAALVNYRANI
jgi:hypothetical protein